MCRVWRDQIKRKPGKLAKAKGAQLAGQSVMTALLHSCTNPPHYPQHTRLIVYCQVSLCAIKYRSLAQTFTALTLTHTTPVLHWMIVLLNLNNIKYVK